MATFRTMVALSIVTMCISVMLLFENRMLESVFFTVFTIFCCNLAIISLLNSILEEIKKRL